MFTFESVAGGAKELGVAVLKYLNRVFALPGAQKHYACTVLKVNAQKVRKSGGPTAAKALL
jgi:hypothetical protein